MGVIVTVTQPVTTVVGVTQPANTAVGIAPVVGPPGPAGVTTAIEFIQSAPAGTWTINHTIGRRPVVAIYIAGELVEADVIASSTAVTVTFPAPVAGTAVLT